jgi:hypothetical protein
MKRVIILRHGEEPNTKSYDETTIGLNDQGAVRALMMPELVQKLLGTNYECHTYTHTIISQPTSRSYYTCQLLNNKVLVYNKSDDIDTLTDNIKKSENNTIIVCWEHKQIPNIIDNLIGKQQIDYNSVVSKIQLNLDKYNLIKTSYININDLAKIEYCADDFLKDNKKVRTNYIEDDMEFSLVWDINMDTNTYTTYPGYVITNSDCCLFLVKQYV